MKKIILSLIVFLPLFINAQEKKENPVYGITFSGFVKNDVFFDNRQTVTIREGHFLLYPDNEKLDVDGKDINAKPTLNMLAIQSRLTGKITGPDAFGAKTSGMIEADFFGNEGKDFADVNGFRIRHAFVKLNWKTTELLFGQYWHPMFQTGCFPGVISFNTGVPFQPFSRNPQIRLTKKVGKLSLMLAAIEQRDFTSSGGSVVLRNSAIPDMQFQLTYGTKNDSAKTEFLVGAGVGYKTIVPRLFSETKDTANKTISHKVNEKVSSLSASVFMKFKLPILTVKVEGVYGQNMYDLVMLGGYAVSGISDSSKMSYDYTTLNTASGWLDIHSNGTKFQIGLFGGYAMNLGTTDEIKGAVSSRGSNIKYVYRAAPRFVFISGKTQFATEIEYTTAAYGTSDNKGIVSKTKDISNLRVLFSAIYNF
ncbi:MAG: hypothetical protein A2033_16660 [Bacteroidetes bacterium GWA2_31_9]|nr:MAG: hypothetical protein A2033_16660 [Bacteroidetes bacterium GWA2_31_9]